MPTNHDLKSVPENFRAIAAGLRKFDVRLNDRNFAIGDTATLREWIPARGRYTDRTATLAITDVVKGDGMNVAPRYVILSYDMIGVEAPPRKAARPFPAQFHVGQVFEFPATDAGGEAFRIRCSKVDDAGNPTEFLPVAPPRRAE